LGPILPLPPWKILLANRQIKQGEEGGGGGEEEGGEGIVSTRTLYWLHTHISSLFSNRC
jgi:hypothetical protein